MGATIPPIPSPFVLSSSVGPRIYFFFSIWSSHLLVLWTFFGYLRHRLKRNLVHSPGIRPFIPTAFWLKVVCFIEGRKYRLQNDNFLLILMLPLHFTHLSKRCVDSCVCPCIIYLSPLHTGIESFGCLCLLMYLSAEHTTHGSSDLSLIWLCVVEKMY